ncbi:TonB-dependent receptor [Sphingobium sp. YG1]|uniref:TonB-dependent receptor n=1 Tax=Sphingobium sp. YG1 TaxID=2082188 RepID=UPI000DBAE7C8|nr:TonB-dependent receptor [Sphingobium sp. YG1]BBD01498.1 hypothetical protein YGS_C1P2753 [Sphingobium sp. YG1]
MTKAYNQSASIAALVVASIATASAQTESQQLDTPARTVVARQDADTGEIVVTAQRRSESINRVPLSIQAFGGEQLRNAGVTDTASLPQLTAGLNFAKSGANTPIYTLRGVGFNTPNLSSTSPVGVYADEVAYAYPYMSNGPVFDLERVEVLKGPQGTLYGRNTTGGLINFLAAKPTDSWQGRIAVELGNYETHNYEGFISGPITETLGIRIAGRWENSDKGWQHSISRDDRLGEKDKLGLRAVVDWNPSDAFSVEVIGSYWRDRSDTTAGQAVALLPNIPGFTRDGLESAIRTNWRNDEADWGPVGGAQAPLKVRSDFYSISGRVKYKLDDALSLVSLTAYNDLRRRDVNDVDGTRYDIFSYAGNGRIQSFSQELRLVGDFDRGNFTVGGYYSHDKIRDGLQGRDSEMSAIRFLRFFAQNVVDPTNSQYPADRYANGFGEFDLVLNEKSRTLSAFINGTYKLTDQLSLTGGLRYTDDRLAANGCARDLGGSAVAIWNTAIPALVEAQTGTRPPNQVVPGGCLGYNATYTGAFNPALPTLREDNVAGRLSLQYTTDGGTLVYGSISRGYKSGAFPLVPINNASQAEPARQERVMAYEVGTKATFLDRRLSLNVAGFYYAYNDKQLFSDIPDIVFTTLTRIVNIPRSEVYGGEAEISWRSQSGFTARGGVAYTGSRVLEYNGFTRSGQPLNFRGLKFANTPELQVNGSLGYSTEVGENLSLRSNINANYQSSTSSSLTNEPGFEVRGYTTVNASITLSKSAGWEVGLWAKNLFNENYWSSANYFADTVYRLPGQPRTFGVTLGWNFR